MKPFQFFAQLGMWIYVIAYCTSILESEENLMAKTILACLTLLTLTLGAYIISDSFTTLMKDSYGLVLK